MDTFLHLKETLYLIIPDKRKFWEIRNLGSMNFIRFGKIKEGVEYAIKSGVSNYDNEQSAIQRANSIIQSKLQKGYTKLTDLSY